MRRLEWRFLSAIVRVGGFQPPFLIGIELKLAVRFRRRLDFV